VKALLRTGVLLGLLAASTTARAQVLGRPMTVAFEQSGPLVHAVAGATLVGPTGAPEPSASTTLELSLPSVAIHARVLWFGSGSTPDPGVTLSTPTVAGLPIVADGCFVIAGGPTGRLDYWRCEFDLLSAGLDVRPGMWQVADLDFDDGPVFQSAQGIVGAFALEVVALDQADPTPRRVVIDEGLQWSRNARVVGPAMSRVVGGGQVRQTTVVLEGDAGLPGDGDCSGTVDDPGCDAIGLCSDFACTAPVAFANDGGLIFNEDAGRGLDIDRVTTSIAVDDYSGMRPFVQSGSDAVLQVLQVIEID